VCGDAVPPTAVQCPTCGASDPIRPGQVHGLTGRRKQRFRLLQIGRVVVVIGIVASLVVLLAQAAFTPAPIAADPLTQTSTLHISPGRFDVITGSITGADYIQGNYTVLYPPGANVTLSIYNASEFVKFAQNQTAHPMESFAPASSARIVFAALYTDDYNFVFQNHYPVGSGLNLTVYVATLYETNVVVG
jgi:hypothetical protein